MKTLIAALALTVQFAQAQDRIGNSSSSPIKQQTGTSQAVTVDEGEYGADDTELGANEGYRGSLPRGHSWRNTQVILKGMKKIRCRMGGNSAKTAAIPALEGEGFCNKMAEEKSPSEYPAGTVWVYHNGEDGNTVVKLKNDHFFSNKLMSAPPPPRANLAAIMVPSCGKKTRKCEPAGQIKKDQGYAKAEKAEAGERTANEIPKNFEDEGGIPPKANRQSESTPGYTEGGDNSKFIEANMFPSKQRLKAEEACGYPNAFRSPVKFNECVDDKISAKAK